MIIRRGPEWLIERTGSLSIDPQRITLMEHSFAGGLALLAQDRELLELAWPLLVDSMLDSRTGTPA